MIMGEEKKGPSQKDWQQQPWFWPVVYSAIALALVGLIVGYNELVQRAEQQTTQSEPSEQVEVLVETAVQKETMKYPFKETYLNEVSVLQDFYDLEADEATRENALLVFNQVYSTSTGVALAINSEPFEVVAAMSGEVSEVKLDAFTGNSITIDHADGYQTRYSSVTDILVKEGDIIKQGEQIATTTDNEWNPTAGIHLFFEVFDQGELMNPRKLLAF